MRDQELMRRISDALDAPGGLEGDAVLRAELDADAALYAADLQAIDAALAGLKTERAEPDWDAMLQRIEEGLDGDLDALADIGDPTLAPRFEGEEREEVEAASVDVEPTVVPEVAATPGGAEVVDLSARRKRRQQLFATIGGLAAAAAVGLGILAGLEASPEAPMASAVMEESAPAATSDAPAAVAPAVVAPASPAEAPAPALQDDELGIGGLQELAAEASEPEAEPVAMATSRSARARRAAAPSDEIQGRAHRGWESSRGGAPSRRAPPLPSLDRAIGGGRGGAALGNPTRAEVVNALNEVAPAVQRCIGRAGELARVHVRVNGSTGRIESTTVSPPYTGSEARCVVRAVRTARMPRSSTPSYEVDHVYRPAPVAGGALRPAAPAARRQRRARPAPSQPAAEPDPFGQ